MATLGRVFKIEDPKVTLGVTAYFPVVALVAAVKSSARTTFEAVVADLEQVVKENELGILVWDPAELNLVLEAFEALKEEAPESVLKLIDLDNLEPVKERYFTHAPYRLLVPSQIKEVPKEGAIKPKIMVIGKKSHHPKELLMLFDDMYTSDPVLRSYGFGEDPAAFDHWYPGPDQNYTGVQNAVTAVNKKNDKKTTEHCVDVVSLAMSAFQISSWTQKNMFDWAESKLRPGGLFVLTIHAEAAREWFCGVLAGRFEKFALTRVAPSSPIVTLYCYKKQERVRDDETRYALLDALQIAKTETYEGPAAMLLGEKSYIIEADREMNPAIFSSCLVASYVERFTAKAPFAALYNQFKRVETARVTTLLVTPSVTHLTKLKLQGVVQGPDGAWIVTKQTVETATSEQKKKELNEEDEEIETVVTQTRKRVRQVSLVLSDAIRPNKHNLKTGDVIIVDAA